ncbi:MAG: D-alanyl-D-alanine carboxypeptidase [Clostridiales bacterium]|nr:D-alanyl-D-alanine carboxypeptidase [Candidatus Crickella caballi]
MVVIFSVFIMLMMVTTITCNVSFAAAKKAAADIKEPTVSATSYVVMSGSTSEVILNSEGDAKLSCGSIAKFMTAMVVLDNMYDNSELDNIVEIGEKTDEYGDSFRKGESATVRDMLYAMLVGGSDEAAEALARYSASDRKIFIKEMNSKAVELELMDTQYTNPTGLQSKHQYSTALDSARIIQAAMRYPLIKTITGTDSYTLDISSKKKARKLTVTNTNPLLSSTKSSEKYKNITGGILSRGDSKEKGGSFDQYAGTAEQDGMEIVVVLLGENSKKTAVDAKNLLAYGFKKVTKNTIVQADKKVGKAKVKGGAVTRVDAYTESKGYAYVPPEGSTNLVQTKTVMLDDLEAPLKAGDKVGEFRIYVADELKGTVDLITKKDVEKGWFPSQIYISNLATVIIAFLLILVSALIGRIVYVQKSRERRREEKRKQMIREAARKQLEIEEDRRRRNWTYNK